MFDLRLFKKPAFVGASVAAFVLSASMFAMFLYLTLYIQNGLEYSRRCTPVCASYPLTIVVVLRRAAVGAAPRQRYPLRS